MSSSTNGSTGNLLAPPPTKIAETHPDGQILAALADGADARDLATEHPASSAAWASLAETALADGDPVAAYAYARTGYHRGLDTLRRSGWRGAGPVPWSHEPNRGVLIAIAMLAKAATALGDTGEADRCRDLVAECDPQASAHTGLA